jgi:anti-sigma regulatory factor (Ser/Thr protein kinase)
VTILESRSLPYSPAAPGLARQHLRERVDGWPVEVVDLAVLMTSELVTNAVVHGHAPVELLVIDDAVRVRVEVADGLPGPLSYAPDGAAVVRTSGRGLIIVDRLADRWGCRPREDLTGKVVWFELSHRAHAGPSC